MEKTAELKEFDVKIKAKCVECSRRLWSNSLKGVYCKNGHNNNKTPLAFRTEKVGNGPKRRRLKGIPDTGFTKRT